MVHHVSTWILGSKSLSVMQQSGFWLPEGTWAQRGPLATMLSRPLPAMETRQQSNLVGDLWCGGVRLVGTLCGARLGTESAHQSALVKAAMRAGKGRREVGTVPEDSAFGSAVCTAPGSMMSNSQNAWMGRGVCWLPCRAAHCMQRRSAANELGSGLRARLGFDLG